MRIRNFKKQNYSGVVYALNYAQSKHIGDFISDSKRSIVFSDEYFDEDEILLYRYSKNRSSLSEIQHSPDRTAENLYFKELLLLLENMIHSTLIFSKIIRRLIS